MRKHMVSVGLLWFVSVFCAGILVPFDLSQVPAFADPLDPADFSSLGASPFSMAGTYTINTSSTPVLSGPSGSYFGFVTADNVAVFYFDDILIGAGVTLRATGSRPVALLSHSTFQLLSGGDIDISGTYFAGQSIAGAGGGSGGIAVGGGPGGGLAGNGSGGGGFGANGGGGGGPSGGAGGIAYGNLAVLLQGGSGGAGGTFAGPINVPGGAGGGGLEIAASGAVTIAGTIKANGGVGFDDFGTGGGSGGGVLLHGPSVTLSGTGTINVMGGSGGAGAAGGGGGGGGASGRVHVLTAAGAFTTDPGFVISTAGGNGGAPNGSSGGSSAVVTGILTTPPPPPAIAGCIEMSGAAAVGATVKVRQKNVHQQTVTDSDGCYSFSSPVSAGPGTITIDLPSSP